MAGSRNEKRLRVLLIDEQPGRAAILEQALTDAGHQVVARFASCDDLIKRVREAGPDVVMVDLDSPDRDTLENMRQVSRDLPRPIVMFAEDGDSDSISAAIRAGVSAYVVDGLAAHRVKPVIEVAIARFREYQALREELERTRESLAERKVVERAKGILMKQRGLTEEEAYTALRKAAMSNNQRLLEVARSIVAVADLLG